MYNIILAFITSFLLTYKVIPPIIKIAKNKKLYDVPDHRTSHTEVTPRLGGIGIFAGLLFSIILWAPFTYLGDLQYILSAFIIIFLIGAKDDIEPISPMTKFGAEFFATLILVFKADVRITSFYGIFGINEIPYVWSVLFSMFVIVAIINAFNLVDGVNGLSGTISVLVSVVLGFWFYKIDRLELSIIAFSMAGASMAFLKYNYTPAKIFMGDTGSLLLGIVSAILAIKFIEINSDLKDSRFYIQSGPLFAVSVLIIPIFDTLRVMTLRIMKRQSPFHPDRQHLHHMLLDVGLSHMQVTFTLVTMNAVFVALGFFLQKIEINLLFVILAVLALALAGILSMYKKKKLAH